jgi:hypothetical protein
VENIRAGIPMFVYPEGTRSKTDALGEFKSGSLKLGDPREGYHRPDARSTELASFGAEATGIGGHVPISVADPIATAASLTRSMKKASRGPFTERSRKQIPSRSKTDKT